MFRVDVATMAKPKTLVGRVHSMRIGPSSTARARILLFLPTAGQAWCSPGPPAPTFSVTLTFHSHKPRLPPRPRPDRRLLLFPRLSLEVPGYTH